MRIRLLVSAAALAAALLLPSGAFAAPVITSPTLWTPPITGGVTTSSTINVEWSDVAAESSFDLWRFDASGAGCLTGLSNGASVSGLLANSVFGFSDVPPQGTYCYFVRADDGVVQSESPGVRITYDATAPGGAVTAPLAGPLGRSVTVSATASDPGGSGVDTVEFQSSPAGAGTWTTFDTDSTGPAYTGTLDTTSLVDGDLYDLRVLVTDLAGNSAPSAVVGNLVVDSSSPSGTQTSPVGGATVRATVPVGATAADVGSGVASVQFQSSPHGAGTWTTYDTDSSGPSPYSGSLDTTTLGGDGSYDLRARVTDNAGNVTNSATVASVVVDNTQPSGAITSPAASAFLNGIVVTNANAADGSGSGVASVQFQSSPHGAATWTTYATDLTGPGPYTGSLNTATLGEGVYDLRVLVTDVAGNPAAASPVVANVTIDLTAPSGTLTSPASSAIVKGSIVTSADVSDGSGSGVASVQFQSSPHGAGTWTTYATDVSGPSPYTGTLDTTTLGGDGLYDLRVRLSDVLANPASFSALVTSVRVDNTRPSTILQPSGVSPVSAAPTISFGASTDAGSGIDHYDVYRAGRGTPINASPILVGSGAPYSWSDAGAASSDPVTSAGTYVYTVVAVDIAGNSSLVSPSRSIDFDPLSQSAPTGVTAAATPTRQAPQISWTAPAATAFVLNHYKVYRDGVALPNVFGTTLVDSTAGEGSHTYQVVASDAGDTTFGFASAAVTVLFDATAPTTPGPVAASAALDGSVAISWGVSSDAGSSVARYVVRRALSSTAPASVGDGDAVCQGLVTSCTDATALNGKLYSYAVFAVDAAGNVSAAGTALSVTASDQLAPATPTGLAATPGDTKVDLRWTAAGASDDVAAYVLVAKPGTAAPTSDTDGTRVCSTLVATSSACSATGLTNGATYTFGLFALDEAFNRSAAATVMAVPNGPVADAKAPAAVKALSVKVSGHTVTLTWKNPADKDFDHVEITASERKPAAHKAAKRVYSGKGTKATTTLAPGQTRWFTVVAYDRVGNASAPATVRAPAIRVVSPFGPAPRAKVHGAVLLRWPVVKGAKYYNVQLYAGKKRVLVSWPAGHGVKLPKAKLKRGTKYTWYVWPGLGAKSKAHYGKLIGKNVFTYAG